MQLKVQPTVEAGTERGGEDLILVCTIEVESETPPGPDEPVEVLFVVADSEIDDLQAAILDEVPEEFDEVCYSGRVKYRTYAYEFEWEGGPEEVLALQVYSTPLGEKYPIRRSLLETIRDLSQWRFCHRPGEPPRLRFELSDTVCGNAE